MRSHIESSAPNCRGMVLVAVLWTIAALSLIVTGVVQAVRHEIRQASFAVQIAQGGAIGNGAIQLVLLNFSSLAQRPSGRTQVQVNFQSRDIQVQVTPLTGFIDLNTGSQQLLEKLFKVAGGLPANQAVAAAEMIVETRNRKDSQGRPLRFEAIEDLLRIPGIDYEIYSKIEGLLTPDARGTGRINVLAAPPPVLQVLADGDEALAQRIARSRDSGAVGLDTAALDPQLVDNAPSARYLLQARVPLQDGAWLLATRWVDINDGRNDGLPWRIFHADNRLEQPPR